MSVHDADVSATRSVVAPSTDSRRRLALPPARDDHHETERGREAGDEPGDKPVYELTLLWTSHHNLWRTTSL